tara:strand:- start:131 stop:577 length:447 start_codon:yes stop_codon:yes gene_type:complete
MTCNLVLKSADSISYASGKAVFKMNWAQFLADSDAEYKVTFSFTSDTDSTLDQSDLYVLALDNIGTLKTIQGGEFNSSITKQIGIIYPTKQPVGAAHARLFAEYSTNPPVDLIGRPTQDILEIAFRDLTGTLLAKTPQFVLFLRFEKV